tara:strand:- start:228 stop:428 length:201 start_codon:yes stop_codon:yes gene_type:complete
MNKQERQQLRRIHLLHLAYWHSTEVEEMESLYTEIRARLEALIEKTEEYLEKDDPTPPARRGPGKK